MFVHSKLAVLAASTMLVIPQIASAAEPQPRAAAIKITNVQTVESARAPSVMMPGMKIGQKRNGGAKGWQKIDPKVSAASSDAITAQSVANAIKKKLDGKSIGFAVTVMTQSGAKGHATGGLARSAPDSGQRA